MIYTAASPEDEAQHIQHHERFLEALRYVVRLEEMGEGGVGYPGTPSRQLQAVLSSRGEVNV